MCARMHASMTLAVDNQKIIELQLSANGRTSDSCSSMNGRITAWPNKSGIIVNCWYSQQRAQAKLRHTRS